MKWDEIYARGEEINKFPFTELVSWFYRNRLLDAKNALDVGCGSGVHSLFLSSHSINVDAFDASNEAISLANKVNASKYIRYFNYKISDWVFEAKHKYDLVVDRCGSTHARREEFESFYKKLGDNLAVGTKVYLECFHPNCMILNNLRMTDLNLHPIFSKYDNTLFFDENYLRELMRPIGLKIDRLRLITDSEKQSGFNHAYWIVEMTKGSK